MRTKGLNKFAYDIKLGAMVGISEGCVIIQRDLSRWEKCADRNLRKYYREKCKVLHVERNNLMNKFIPGATQLKK